MYNFLKTQKKKLLIALITVIMMLSGLNFIPTVSTVLAVEGDTPVITPLSIDSSGRTSGEITTSTNISFRIEDNNKVTGVWYLWDKNISGASTYTKVTVSGNPKSYTFQVPTSTIPKELGVHELSIYAYNGSKPSLVKTIPYYVVSSLTGKVDNQAPTLVMPTTRVLKINHKLPLKYIENETAMYRIRYEWSTNSEREFENETSIYKPANGEIEIQTPSTPGIWYLKTDGTDASNKTYEGAVIEFDIRKELNPPTINGVGSTEVFHQKGTEYTYPNVTAIDDTDGTVIVNKTTNLDTNKVGNYTITYTATDSSKNQARVDVIVHVIDYSLLDEELEKAKDLVETDYDKETWDKLQEEIKKAEDLKNENQSLQDKIDEIIDNIKNIIKETQKEENIKTPTITNMQVTAPGYIKVGDKITFTFASDTELNSNQKITINGVAVNVTLTGEFPNYTAELTIPSDNKMTEGPIKYTFQAEKTLTTVAGTQITKISDPQEGTLENIKLDKTKPTITYKDTVKFDKDGNAYIELLAKDTYNKGIDYAKYLEITENYGTPAENWLFVSGAIDTNVPKETPYVLTYTVTDLAGNSSEPATLNIYVRDYIETIEIKDTTKKTYTYGQTVQKQDAIADITMAGGTRYEAVSLSSEAISSIQSAITLSVDSQDAGNRIVTITYKTKTAESTLGDKELTYNITIEKATYNIEGIKFQDKNNREIAENGTIVYDGTAQTLTATNLPTTPAGLSIASYTYKNLAGATVTEVKDAGTYTVTVNFQVADSNNFEVPASITRKFEITKKELNLSDLEITKPTAPLTYSKDAQITATAQAKSTTLGLGTITHKYYKITETKNENEETIITETPIENATSVTNAGKYKVKISINGASNYKITAGELEIASFEIKKATYDIKDVTFSGKTTTTYDGQPKQLQIANEPTGITNISYVYKDKAGNVITEEDGITPVASVKNAGEYTVVATLEGDTENYELVPEQTAKLTINKKPITITAQDQTSVYGSEVVLDQTKYTKTDLVSGDTLEVVLSTSATQTPVVGTYDITAEITISDNYEVTYNKGTYEITRKLLELSDLDVTMPDSLEYDGNSKIVTVTPKADTTGIGTPIKIYYYKDGTEANKTETAPINAGTYAVRVEVPQGDNYTASGAINEEATFVKGLFNLNDLVIAPKSARVTMDEQSSIYGDPIVTKISTVATGVVGTDDLELTLTPVDGEGNQLTATSPANDNYQIIGTSANKNYNVEIVPGKYVINPKSLADVTRTVTEPIGDALIYVKGQAKEVTGVLTTTINKEVYTLIKQDEEHETNYDYVETVTYYELAKPEDTEKETINGKEYKEIKNNGKPENVGTYIAKITFTGNGNFTGERINYSKEYTIIKADPEYTVPTGLEENYNTKLSEVELPEGFAFENMTADTVVGDVGTNNFTLTYTPKDTNNYNVITKIPVTIKVNPIKFPLSGYTLDAIISKEYQEGTKQTVKLEGLPAGISATYTYKAADGTTTTDGMIDYGDYEVTVTLGIIAGGPLAKNYNGVNPEELKTTLRITKSVYKLEEKFNLGFTGDTNPTYSGEIKTLTLTNETAIKTAGIDVDYEYYKTDENGNIILDQKLDGAPVDAGKYVVRAQFKLTEGGPLSQNYGGITPSNKDANLEISPKAPTVSDLTITMPENLEYDGEAKQVIVKSKNWTAEKPNGDGLGDITVYYYKDGKLVENEDGTPATSVKDFGTYNIKVSITKGTNYKETTLLDLGEINNLVITKKPLHNDDVDTNQVATTVEYGSDVAVAVRAQIEKAIKPGVTAEIKSVTYNNTTTMPTEVREEAYTIIVILKGTGNYSPEEKDNVRIEAKCTITPRQIKAEEISITEPTANLVYSKNSEGVEQTHPVSTKISTSINGVNYDLDEDDVTITPTYYVETTETDIPEEDKYETDGKTYKKISGAPVNAGTYIAKITVTGKGNFKNTSVEKYSSAYTIDKAMYELDKTGLDLVVTPTTDKIVYNGNPYSLAIPASNKPTGLNIKYTYNGEEATGATDAGTYAVVATFDLDSNLSKNYYNTNLVKEKITGTLVIEKADEATPEVKLVQVVDGKDEELTYSDKLESYVIKMTGANPTLRISNNSISGSNMTITTSNNKITINEKTNEVTLNQNGEVTITVTFPESKNYKAKTTIIKLTIELDGLGHEDFEVDQNTTTYTYDATGKTATVTTAMPEVETGKVTKFYYKMNGETPDTANKLTAPVDAGTYGIYVETAGGTKYEAVTTAKAIRVGTLTINKRPVTITADNKTSVYRDELAKLTYTITPGAGLTTALVGTDKETVSLTTTATPTSPVSGTYKITGTYGVSDNYEITFVEGTYTLTKRMPTINDVEVTMPSNLEYNGEAKTVTVVPNPVTGETLAGKGLGIIKVYYGETETAPVDAGTYKVKVAIEEGSNYTESVVEVESEDGEKTLEPTKFNLPDLVITPKSVTVTITKATSKYGETPSIEKTIPTLIGQDTLGESIIAVEKDGETEISGVTPVGAYDIKTNYTNKNYKVTFVQTGSEKLKYEITPNEVKTIRVIAPTENLVFTEKTEHPVTVEVLDPTKTDGTLLTEKTAEQDGQYTKTVTYYEPATAEDTNTVTINGKEYKKVTGIPIEAGTYIAKAEVTGLGNFATEAPVVGYSEEYTISKAPQNPPVVNLYKTSTTGDQLELDKIDGQEGKYIEKITTNKIIAVVLAGKGDTTYDVTPKDIITIDENGKIELQKAGEVTITVTYEGDKNYNPNSSTVSLKVIKDTLDVDDFGVEAKTDIYTYDGTPKKATVISTIKAGDRGEVTETYHLIREDEEGNEISVDTEATARPINAGKYAIFVKVTEGEKYEAVDYETINSEGAIRLKDKLVINPRPATVTITKAESKFGEDINIVKTTEGEVTKGEEKEDLGLSLIAVEKDGTTPITSSTGVGTYEIKTNATNKNYKVTFVPAEPVYKITANPITEANITIELPEGTLTYEEGQQPVKAVKVTNPSDLTKLLVEKTEETPNGNYEITSITYYKKVETIPAGTPASNVYQDENESTYVKIEGIPENAGTYIAKVEITGLGNFETKTPVVKYSGEYTINKATQPDPIVELQREILTETTVIDPKDGVYEIEITELGKIKAVVTNQAEKQGEINFKVVEGNAIRINNYGQMSIAQAGTATIKALFTETENYEESSITLKLNIVKGKLTEANFALKPETDIYPYDSTAKGVEILTPSLTEKEIGKVTPLYYLINNGIEADEPTENPTDAGEYAIYVIAEGGEKYQAITDKKEIKVEGKLTITQRKISVTANPQTSKYRDQLEELTYVIASLEQTPETLFNGDKETVTIHTEATTTSNVKDYAIIVDKVEIRNKSGQVSQNYNVKLINGTYTITKRKPAKDDLNITIPYDAGSTDKITFDGDPKTVAIDKKSDRVGLGGTGDWIVTNYYELDEQDQIIPDTKSPVAPTKAGTYRVTVDITEGQNYTKVDDLIIREKMVISPKTITQNDITITVPTGEKYEEEIGHPVTVTATTGITYTQKIKYYELAKEGDQDTVTIDGKKYKELAGIPINAGTYKAEVAIKATGDYVGEFTKTSSDYTIANAPQDMTGITLSESLVKMTESAPTINLNGKAKGPISYSLVPNSGESTVQNNVIDLNTETGEIALLGKGKVTILVTYGAVTNYDEGTKRLELEVQKDTLKPTDMIVEKQDSYLYDGKTHTATVTSGVDGVTDNDIEVIYKLNGEVVTPVDAGTYDIVINVSATTKYEAATIEGKTSKLLITPVTITEANKDQYLAYETIYENTRKEVNYKKGYKANVDVKLKPEYTANGNNKDVEITTLYNNGTFRLDIDTSYKVTAHMENSRNFIMPKDIEIYTFTIVDNEAPTIEVVNGVSANKITVDKTPIAQNFDYKEYIKVTDNYSENIELLPVTGDKVDTSKIGSYTVIITAVDEKGNRREFSLEVEVINGPPLVFFKLAGETTWTELTKEVAEGYVSKELRTVPTINWLHGDVIIKRKHIDLEKEEAYTETYYNSKTGQGTTIMLQDSGWYKITVSDGNRTTEREIKIDLRQVEVSINNKPRRNIYDEDVNLEILNENNNYIVSADVTYIDTYGGNEQLQYVDGKILLNLEQKEYERKVRISIVAKNGQTKSMTIKILAKAVSAEDTEN